MFSAFKKMLKRHIKGSIVSAYSLKLAEMKLKEIKSYQKVKTAHNRLSDTVASKSDVVTVGMVRAMKRKYEEDVVEAAQKAVRIAKAKLKRERKKREKERFEAMEIGLCEAQKGCSSTSQTARRQRKGLCSCSRRRLDVCKKRH